MAFLGDHTGSLGTMPRVPYPEYDNRQAELEAIVRESRHGQFLHLYRMLLHAPDIALEWLSLGSVIRYGSDVRDELRELAICSVAAAMGSHYEWHHHAPLAEAAGIDASQLQGLWADGGVDGFSNEHRLCARYASSVARGQVTDGMVQEVVSVFGVEILVELTAIASYYTGVSRFLESLDIDIEGAV